MATCRRCQTEIPKTGKPGRPPALCLDCRAAHPAGHKRISPQVSGESGAKPGVGGDAAPASSPTPLPPKRLLPACGKFRPDPHPAAWRFCSMCGRSKETHQ